MTTRIECDGCKREAGSIRAMLRNSFWFFDFERIRYAVPGPSDTIDHSGALGSSFLPNRPDGSPDWEALRQAEEASAQRLAEAHVRATGHGLDEVKIIYTAPFTVPTRALPQSWQPD